MVKAENQNSAWRNPWVWMLVGIMGAAIIVNLVLITLAFMSPPGLVVEDYYEKGKSYFYNQAQAEKDQARLGWNLELEVPQTPSLASPTPFLVRALDRDGKPIEGANVEFAAFRPAENGKDFFLPMLDVGAGYYSANVNFKFPGNWDLILTVHQGEDKLDIAERIYVQD